MTIRDPFTTELADPPEGCVRIAFWRHLTETSADPELQRLHEQRAEIVHELVDRSGVTVADWGDVDGRHPAEVVEILVSAFAGAVATEVARLLADWIKDRRHTPKSLRAVTIRRPGAEIVWEFRAGVSGEQAAAAINQFVAGGAVERVLGR